MDVFIEKIFNASPERVFSAWTDAAKLAKWYAPVGCSVIVKKIDARPGGTFLFCISNPQVGACWATGIYEEVIPGERLVMTMMNADENGNPINPTTIGFAPDWPAKTLVTVTFTAVEGKTLMQLRQTVPEAIAKRTGAYTGWVQMFDNLEGFLGK